MLSNKYWRRDEVEAENNLSASNESYMLNSGHVRLSYTKLIKMQGQY